MKLVCQIIFSTCIYLLCSPAAHTQIHDKDSLKNLLSRQQEDSNKINMLCELGSMYIDDFPDTAVVFAQQALQLANKLQYPSGILNAELILSYALTTSGNYPLATDFGFKALATAKKSGSPSALVWANARLAQCYFYQGDATSCLRYDREIYKIVQEHFPDSVAFIYTDFAKVFTMMGQPDSAYYYAVDSYQQINKWHYNNWYTVIYPVLGNAYAAVKKYDSALLYFKAGIGYCIKSKSLTELADIYNGMADVFNSTGNRDSAMQYARLVVQQNSAKAYPNGLLKAASMLTEIYQVQDKPDSTLKYLRIATGIKDSLFTREKTIAIQNIAYKEQEKQRAVETAKLEAATQLRIFLLTGLLIVTSIIAGVWFRSRKLKQMQQLRNSIADDLHDDIGSALSSISIMNELAKLKSTDALPLLKSIGENAAAIQENMSDIVWAVNPANDVFANMLQRMQQFATEILEAANIKVEFFIDDALYSCKLSMEKRKNLYLFFKEAINNAAKYSAAKNVFVRLHKKGVAIEMVIEDDGRGFDTKQAFFSNGINTLKRRAAELNASHSITSQLNIGTKVYLSFKLN